MVLAALGIGLLIFIHEFGHFLAARAAGVRVEVFSLGFGPRLLGWNVGGTDFRLSLVPFGGYVMVAGQDPSDRRFPKHMSLYSKSIGQRALFWSGGVLMNALFALVVFPLVFRAGVTFVAPVIGVVTRGSAAWEAGIEPGDRIVAVKGKEVLSLDNMAVEIALHGQRPVDLLVRRAGQDRVVTVAPQFDRESGLYQLGVSPADGDIVLQVAAGGPAAAAGLRHGDVLQAVNGIAANADTPAVREVLESAAGAPLELRVRRGEAAVNATVQPVRRAEDSAPRIGVRQTQRRIAGIRPGAALVERLGLRRDDVLLALDGLPFLGGDLQVAANGPERLVVHVLRDGKELVLEQAATTAERAGLASHVALANDPSMMLHPTEGGAALAAGLQPGDWLESIDGKPVGDWGALTDVIEASAGKQLVVRLRRLGAGSLSFFDSTRGDLPLGEPVELTMVASRHPVFDHGIKAEIETLREEVRAGSFGEALLLGTVCSLDLVKQFYVTLKRLVTGDVGAKNLSGIIRIGQVSYHAARRGPSWFWYFLALLSVNLAFVNLLPIPVLDGGHLLFLLIEKVKGSPVSARVFGYSQVVGLLFVLLLVLFVTYNDILRLL